MTTYVYETVQATDKDEPKLYEIKQSMSDAPLTQHPETGEPIRRVILGGYGLMKKDAAANDCGPGCGCC